MGAVSHFIYGFIRMAAFAVIVFFAAALALQLMNEGSVNYYILIPIAGAVLIATLVETKLYS